MKILFVDDDPIWLATMRNAFSRDKIIKASFAQNLDEANYLMFQQKFDCLLLDVHLGDKREVSGIELARWYRQIDPQAGIILYSGKPRSYYTEDLSSLVDDCLEKTIGLKPLKQAIINVVNLKKMSYQARLKRFAILKEFMPYRQTIRQVNRTGDESGAERLEGILTADNIPIAWDIYNFPGTEERKNVIGLTSTSGCVGRCKFCLSGNRLFRRALSVGELISQVLHALQSYHASGCFERMKKLVINFTCEGDAIVSNLDNACEAVRQLQRLKLDLSFIITTIGHEQSLAKFMEKYIDLPVTLYWSVNFLNQDMRALYMPATKNQSLEELRDIFQKISEKTGRPITVSWILMKGINDGDKDIELLRQFFGNRPFEIKVMALEPNSLEGIKTKEEDVDKFMNKLREAGLPCRKKEIVGGRIKSGCGTTIPIDISNI